MTSLPPTLHPLLSNKPSRLAQLPQILLGPSPPECPSHHMGQESTKTVEDMKTLHSFLESQTCTVLNKPASGSPSKEGRWTPEGSGVPRGSRAARPTREQPGSPSKALNSPALPPHHSSRRRCQRETGKQRWLSPRASSEGTPVAGSAALKQGAVL